MIEPAHSPVTLNIPDVGFERELVSLHNLQADEGRSCWPLLRHWLRRDTWLPREGLPILLGIHPEPGQFLSTACPDLGHTTRIISARFLDGALVCLGGYHNALAWAGTPEGAIEPADLPVEIAVSAITMAELAAGPHATTDPTERARRQDRLQRAEATFEPLP